MHEFFIKKKYVIVLTILSFSIVTFILIRAIPSDENSTFSPNEIDDEVLPVDQQEEIVQQEEEKTYVYVDIKGSVKRPGVYKLNIDDRVIDAIEAAGGFLETADQITVNLAAKLLDGQMIYVPKEGEQLPSLLNGQKEEGKIRINFAEQEELTKLPGIGITKAEAIVFYREENGLFQKMEDILNVSGIGPSSLEKIRDKITLR